MFDSLKRLFTSARTSESSRADERGFDDGSENSDAVRRYFELSSSIEQHKSDGDFRAAVSAARRTYEVLPEFVRDTPDAAMLRSHAVHTAPTLMAILEDREAIDDLRRTLERIPELQGWLEWADGAENDLKVVQAIMREVMATPGLIQTTLKSRLGLAEGHRIGQLASWLEKGKRIRRVRKGSSYQLYPYDHLPASDPATQPNSDSAPAGDVRGLQPRSQPNRKAVAAREIDLSKLPLVRLPMAPASWEERRRPAESAPADRVKIPLFRADGEGWEPLLPEKLAASERPDPTFREAYHTSGSTFWVDPKGKTERFNTAPSVLRAIDRRGKLVGDRGLSHDVYRTDVNADGSAVLFLSRDGVLHAYSDDLSPLFAEWLTDLPEYRAQAERLTIPAREIKSHTRCIGISTDHARYLVTIVDEAYCFDAASHRPLWAVRTPIKEGWTRVESQRSALVGTDTEVSDALRLMEIQLPVSPEELTQQYRKLALRWHPDRNPGDATATARFQSLRHAFELLTGIDVQELSTGQTEAITYQRILQESTVHMSGGGAIGISFFLGASEKSAADWIYAANFASTGNGAYIATYSGKVIQLSDEGTPIRVYDIGSVPRHIAETGGHLYLLTDTRLYVLQGDRLTALVDVFDQGDLIIGDTGFGLLDSKSFSWFSPTGSRLGVIRSRDPMRRVMSTQQGLLVETRQHRVLVPGAQSWWR